jgi:hypothetical protein
LAAQKDTQDRAIVDFNRAIELDPDNVDGYLRRGLLAKQRGDERGARADLEAVIARVDAADARAREAHTALAQIRKLRPRVVSAPEVVETPRVVTISVPHDVLPEGSFMVTYSMDDPKQLIDFEATDIEAFQIETLVRPRVTPRGRLGLHCRAFEKRGVVRHSTPLDGMNFEINVDFWLKEVNSRSQLVFTLGPSRGVSFGQQLVTLDENGTLRVLDTRPPNMELFKGDRIVTTNLLCQNGKLTVTVNGTLLVSRQFDPAVLQGPFGLVAQDVDLQITHLTIRGNLGILDESENEGRRFSRPQK